MRELADLNCYLHDFSAAMWTCGAILMWMMRQQIVTEKLSAETVAVLIRFIRNLWRITIPAIILVMLSGVARAILFLPYEHIDVISTAGIAFLIVKHLMFTLVVGWGIWVHARCRKLWHRAETQHVPSNPAVEGV